MAANENILLDTALRWFGAGTWVRVKVDGFDNYFFGQVDKDSGPQTQELLEYVKRETGYTHLWVYELKHLPKFDRGIAIRCKGMV